MHTPEQATSLLRGWGRWTPEEKAFVQYKCKQTDQSRLSIFTQFVKKFGLTHSLDALQRYITTLQQQGIVSYRRVAITSLRIGYVDIEATDLQANFGIMLSYYMKPKGVNLFYKAIITPDEIRSGKGDKRILRQFMKDIQHFDVLYFHYGQDNCFDTGFIRSRLIANKLMHLYAKMKEVRIRDTWPIARNKLKLSNNRQDTIADHLEVAEKKTPLSPSTWRKAARGNKRALAYIDKHNKNDVLQLEAIHKVLALVEKPRNIF